MEKLIQYCGNTAKVKCDEKCHKAWGGNSRPRVYPDISETQIFGLGDDSIYPEDDNTDVDNYAYCSDEELGDAPVRPNTEEGGHRKPVNKDEIGNKWCIRECERCVMSAPYEYDKPLELNNFDKK